MKNRCIRRLNIIVLFILIGMVQLRSQGDFISYGRNRNYEYNDCLWYNVYTVSAYYADSMVIDTANLCRVKRNGIRSVSVYRFSSWEDTTLIRHIVYDTNGFFMNSISNGQHCTMNCDFCDSFNYATHQPRRTVQRFKKAKHVWIRNDSGYIKEYRYFNRGGPWNRFIEALICQQDFKCTYTYTNEGRTITQNKIPKRYFSIFRRWTRSAEFKTVYVFDENENLISEHQYDMRGEEPDLYYSYIYQYEYF